MDTSIPTIKKEKTNKKGGGVVFNFRADEEMLIAIDKIVATFPAWMGKGGGRSAAIRKAILEVASKL